MRVKSRQRRGGEAGEGADARDCADGWLGERRGLFLQALELVLGGDFDAGALDVVAGEVGGGGFFPGQFDLFRSEDGDDDVFDEAGLCAREGER